MPEKTDEPRDSNAARIKERLLWRYRILGVKVQLPAPVTTEPNTGDIGIAGQCACTTSWRLGGVIDEGGDVRSDERNAWIKKFDWSKGAVLMKLFDESKHLVPVPYLLFDTGEVGQKQFRKIFRVTVDVCFPKGIFLRDDHVRLVCRLSEQRHSGKEQG